MIDSPAARRSARGRPRLRVDALACGPLRAALLWPGFPLILQVAALGAVLWLAAMGLGAGVGMSPGDLMLLRKTNIATLVVWGLWWPGMIVAAILLGRVWCTVCPMELANRVGDAVAGAAGWPRARLGKALRAGRLTIALYLVLQLLVAGASLHRTPHYTAIFLLSLLALALLSGAAIRDPRSFCSAFCPAAALLSVYGRRTRIQLDVRDPAICDACRNKDCVRAENRLRFDRRSCPSLLRPFRREPSDGCVLCFQCAKTCSSQNVGFGVVTDRSPLRKRTLLRPFEAAFVMIALGFVTHEVAGEVTWLDAAFHRVPSALYAAIALVPFGWIEALWFLALFPLCAWALIAGLGYLAGHRASLGSLLLAAATGAAPAVATAHLAKAAAKLASWGGYLPLAVRDPRGLETWRRLAEHSAPIPDSLIGLRIIGWTMFAALALMTWRTWRWIHDVPPGTHTAARAGLVTAAALLAGGLGAWISPWAAG